MDAPLVPVLPFERLEGDLDPLRDHRIARLPKKIVARRVVALRLTWEIGCQETLQWALINPRRGRLQVINSRRESEVVPTREAKRMNLRRAHPTNFERFAEPGGCGQRTRESGEAIMFVITRI